MTHFRFSRIPPTRLPRRSFVIAAGGWATILAFGRGAQAVEVSADADRDGAARSLENPTQSSSPPSSGIMDLKELGLDHQVAAVSGSNDIYRVTTASGRTLSFPEFNLRFKTDSSDRGPARGRPVLLPTSMDRAFVVFAEPDEISSFITQETGH